MIRANPLSEQEQTQVARARTGDFTGLLTYAVVHEHLRVIILRLV